MQKDTAQRGRLLLEPGNVIVLKKNDGNAHEESFLIDKVEGCGGSAVCYSASLNGRNGKLKEFYPADIDERAEQSFYSFRRSESNQLLPVGCYTDEMFKALKKDFISTHKMLEQAKNKNAVLNNYMHTFELYYGYEQQESASVYIWTPDDYSGKRYDKFVEENYACLNAEPMKALKNIVQSIKTLSEGICALHFAEFYHLDINLTNFMLKYKGGGEVDTCAVYLFDLNSLNLMDCDRPLFAGTVGFIAPEVYYGKLSVRADIYSIGATLFSALMFSPDGGFPLYSDRSYSKIKDMIFSCDIITQAENKDVFLIDKIKDSICSILRCCLAKNQNQRFKCCEELIDELDNVIEFISASNVLESLSKR